jgi:glucose/arabinose dehydrogenase
MPARLVGQHWNNVPVRKTHVIVLLTAMVVVAGCSSDSNAPDPVPPSPAASAPASSPDDKGAGFSADRVKIALRPYAEGFVTPVVITHAGDDRLFVAEQTGYIRVVRDGDVASRPFLDIDSLTTSGGEQGLLGLAFHPDYQSNGFFFINYTDNSGDTVVARYQVSDDPDIASPGSEQVLLRVDQPYSNHNGGGLAFGADGYLYIGLGDGGSAGDPENRAQDLGTPLGKMLRIDVDARSGDPQYGIPEDNPFAGRSGARPEIWLYGLRNPWRFSFDREGGDLWLGDVGQGEIEEIDRVAPDDGGLNLGWRLMEGDRCYESDCDRDGLTLPVSVYEHGSAHCSVTGGYVYRGSDVPSLEGGYLFADYCSGVAWVLDASTPIAGATRVLDTDIRISSFGEDLSGELYVADHGLGRILKVVSG